MSAEIYLDVSAAVRGSGKQNHWDDAQVELVFAFF